MGKIATVFSVKNRNCRIEQFSTLFFDIAAFRGYKTGTLSRNTALIGDGSVKSGRRRSKTAAFSISVRSRTYADAAVRTRFLPTKRGAPDRPAGGRAKRRRRSRRQPQAALPPAARRARYDSAGKAGGRAGALSCAESAAQLRRGEAAPLGCPLHGVKRTARPRVRRFWLTPPKSGICTIPEMRRFAKGKIIRAVESRCQSSAKSAAVIGSVKSAPDFFAKYWRISPTVTTFQKGTFFMTSS